MTLAERISESSLSVLRDALRGHRRCAVLDFPDHGNVGDSAIWLGEMLALAGLSIEICYVANLHSLDESTLRSRMPDGVVLIHGGGNFGNLWPECQQHRERALETLRDYPIVQLPQSIHYASADDAAVTRALIAAHPDFTLMVRDENSRRFAEIELGARTVMCSDSAFFLHGRLPPARPVVDVFVLARTDKEHAGFDLVGRLHESGLDFEVGDWLDDPMTWSRRLALQLWPRSFGRLTRVPGFFALLAWAWEQAAWARVRRGCALLSRGRVVITDRLHAHILCTMLGIPHVALDNHYGKVGSFIEAWSLKSPLVHRASSVEEAVALAQRLLSAELSAGRS